ncbi:MAG: phenylalanine--tRNA ligase subunit alpha [Candidatus Omnitrophica bacterium]|nr:Phenylalanine--tRNA ligase alpha subunit [bacterium]NUN97388.1 phenylalanine--tRNA ligase subunit alpha [Candidatus Omnitrophota bacterium]
MPTAGLEDHLAEIRREGEAALAAAVDLRALEEARVRFLGRKGRIKELLKGLGSLTPEERPKAGAEINRLHDEFEANLEKRRAELEQLELARRLCEERVDITLPGRDSDVGSLHPTSLIIDEIASLFSRMGYDIHDDREIENDYYNFEALNFPADHPARDMQDTFFLESGLLLRSHTSNGQIHYMENHKPPLAVIVPGRVYRRDSDPTHLPMFHQVEGLMVGKGISMANLKWTLDTMMKTLFGPTAAVRLRPSFFPFTEPSAEVDMWFEPTPGKGRWLEMGGAGMVHPNVLLACRIDPEEWTGFAFGMGVERMAMVKYGVPDIRMLYENDIRFLRQFRGLSRIP